MAEKIYWDFYKKRTKELVGGGEYDDSRAGYKAAQEDAKSQGFEKTPAVRDSNGKVIEKERIEKVPVTMRQRPAGSTEPAPF